MQLSQAIRKITGAKKLGDHRTIAQTVNKWFEFLTFGFTSKRSKCSVLALVTELVRTAPEMFHLRQKELTPTTHPSILLPNI